MLFCDSQVPRIVIRSCMGNSSDDAEERERAELVVLARQALEERERLLAERRALLQEIARLKRLRDRPGRNSRGTS